ncbi:hypothetical protein PoB_000289200 [Plakobranchus ocellatus]|uniref:Uncharacterized protein n=1 Tax=Plakobranchus ocellatus TaxID=259542 RepID=A0AAV3Y2U0_9GAST|nr:hypothetical protein PoB_000289200 [Plakobranchus ocellatus]
MQLERRRCNITLQPAASLVTHDILKERLHDTRDPKGCGRTKVDNLYAGEEDLRGKLNWCGHVAIVDAQKITIIFRSAVQGERKCGKRRIRWRPCYGRTHRDISPTIIKCDKLFIASTITF